MPDHTKKTNATKRMLELWRTKGPDFGRSDEAQDHGQLQWHADALANSGPPLSVSELADIARAPGAIDKDRQAAEITRNIIAEKQETINRAGACLWRMREAAAAVIADYAPMLDQIISLAARTGVPYNFDPHAAANALAAVMEEPPFTSLAIVKREAVAEFLKVADDQGGYGSHESRVWMDDNLETFFNE